MNTIIQNGAKILVSAALATFITALVGGMVAASAGNAPAAVAAQQGYELQAQALTGATARPCRLA